MEVRSRSENCDTKRGHENWRGDWRALYWMKIKREMNDVTKKRECFREEMFGKDKVLWAGV